MKIILNELSVWWFRASSLVFGGTLLLSLSALSGNRWKLRMAELKPVLFCGLFSILGWMVFSAYGVSLMPAGRASIIAFTMPLWATLFAAGLLGEKINATKIIGLMLGLAGLAVLIGPDLVILERALTGSLFMLLAALSWAFGTVLIKRFHWQLPVLTIVSWQLLFSAIPILIIAISFEPVPEVSNLSLKAIVALVYLFLFPMSFCQWAYFKTVTLLPASVAAIGTLMVPVIGVYSSHLILDESVGTGDLVALSLIVLSLVLVLLVPAMQRRSVAEPTNL